MPAEKKPIAFMSYASVDDPYGRLTQFRERLSREVRQVTGKDFEIFQDRKDIKWGQQWRARIEGSLETVTFLIAILTPSFFASEPCREEVGTFLQHEARLKRSDLLLGVHYVECPLLLDEAKRANHELAKKIADRQYVDWRDIRHETFNTPAVGLRLERLAFQIRDAIERVQTDGATAPSGDSPPAGTSPAPASTSERHADAGDANLQTQSGTSEGASTLSTPGQTRGASPRARPNEPETLLVDISGQAGAHQTIGSAIQAAKPGGRIIVRPGVYNEGIVMDKPLEIIGQNDTGPVVLKAAGQDAMLFNTTLGRIANLTLLQTGDGKWYGVDIAQGRLLVEGCDISSGSLACVAIHEGAEPVLRNNRIHDGKAGGVFIYENGRGTLEDNDIFGNTFAGLEIKEGGNPKVRGNRIHDGKQSGVLVHENGRGTPEDNDIFGNALAGVAIREGSNPILRGNRIHDGKAGGVYVHKNGRGTLEDNDIFGNAVAGLEIKEGSKETLRGNRIHDGKGSGVYIHENGRGTLEDNDIFGNALAGLEIKEGGNPMVRGNRIHDGKQSGVFVYENGRGTLEDNDIFGNERAGVAVSEGGNPIVHNNRITKNKYEGVWVYDGGAGVFEDNDLRGNERGAWDIAAECEVNVKRGGNQE